MQELFERIQELQEEKVTEVTLSYLEIYNEAIHDLLAPPSSSVSQPPFGRTHPFLRSDWIRSTYFLSIVRGTTPATSRSPLELYPGHKRSVGQADAAAARLLLAGLGR